MEKRAKSIITEKTFSAVHILTKGGATIPEIVEYLGISPATVSRIRACESWAEYCQAKRASAFVAKTKSEEKRKQEEAKKAEPKEEEKKPESQVVEHRQTVTIVANHYMAEEMRKQTELLQLISNKLAYIVEQLS